MLTRSSLMLLLLPRIIPVTESCCGLLTLNRVWSKYRGSITELKSPEGELSRDRIRSRWRCDRNDWIFGDHSGLGDETPLVIVITYTSPQKDHLRGDVRTVTRELGALGRNRRVGLSLQKTRIINCTDETKVNITDDGRDSFSTKSSFTAVCVMLATVSSSDRFTCVLRSVPAKIFSSRRFWRSSERSRVNRWNLNIFFCCSSSLCLGQHCQHHCSVSGTGNGTFDTFIAQDDTLHSLPALNFMRITVRRLCFSLLIVFGEGPNTLYIVHCCVRVVIHV